MTQTNKTSEAVSGLVNWAKHQFGHNAKAVKELQAIEEKFYKMEHALSFYSQNHALDSFGVPLATSIASEALSFDPLSQ